MENAPSKHLDKVQFVSHRNELLPTVIDQPVITTQVESLVGKIRAKPQRSVMFNQASTSDIQHPAAGSGCVFGP